MATPAPAKPAKVKKEKERRVFQPLATERLKTVIRRLPPNLPEDIFWQSVQLWVTDETTTWKAYYPGKLRKKLNKENIPSRAYVAFKTEDRLAVFSREYDGHIFRDKNGVESQTVVEFAPYQKVPSEKKKPDNRNGTIDKDEDFISFVESLKASENAEPVSLEVLIASSQPAPAPKTTPLLEALKAEKSAARDKEAILRNHAHYKQVEIAQRKEDKKKGPAAASASTSKAADAATRRAAKKAHTQAQAQAQAVAAAAVQAAANPAKAAQLQKTAATGTNASSSRPPRPPKSTKGNQPAKPSPAQPATATDGAETIPVPTGQSSSDTTTPAPRRSRPVLGLGSRQFEAALNIAGLANSASERRRREKEKASQAATPTGPSGTDGTSKFDSKGVSTPTATVVNLPEARIDTSDHEQEKERQGPKITGVSPKKDRPRRGGRGGGDSMVGSSLQRADGSTAGASVAGQKPPSTSASGTTGGNPTLGTGSPPRSRRGRGRGRGGAPQSQRGG